MSRLTALSVALRTTLLGCDTAVSAALRAASDSLIGPFSETRAQLLPVDDRRPAVATPERNLATKLIHGFKASAGSGLMLMRGAS